MSAIRRRRVRANKPRIVARRPLLSADIMILRKTRLAFKVRLLDAFRARFIDRGDRWSFQGGARGAPPR
jgi:hypothetical protein